jgi:hypothetical protein
MQEAHVVLLSRLHWLLCTGLIVAESGTAVKQASDLHCSSGALGGREADERPSGQAVMAEKSIPPRRSASICMRCAHSSISATRRMLCPAAVRQHSERPVIP